MLALFLQPLAKCRHGVQFEAAGDFDLAAKTEGPGARCQHDAGGGGCAAVAFGIEGPADKMLNRLSRDEVLSLVLALVTVNLVWLAVLALLSVILIVVAAAVEYAVFLDAPVAYADDLNVVVFFEADNSKGDGTATFIDHYCLDSGGSPPWDRCWEGKSICEIKETAGAGDARTWLAGLIDRVRQGDCWRLGSLSFGSRGRAEDDGQTSVISRSQLH